MTTVTLIKRLTLLLVLLVINNSLKSQELPNKTDVISDMKLVNDYWIGLHSDPGNNKWARAAYFTGNMAMYNIYPRGKYLDYATYWAELNNWAPGDRPRHADDHCCGQTYIDLFHIEQDSSRILKITQTIDAMVNSEKKDDWNWVDALYMAMPVFARLGVLYDDSAYFDKVYDLYNDTKERRILYDTEYGLWYRDEKYSAPEDTTANGERIFWSRGNGWVFGAHTQTLQLLPENDPHRTEYITTYQEMAAALKKAQQSDGFWGVSLADSNHYPGPETSGTGFFTFGLAWGINNDLLDSATYYPVVLKAWNGLVNTAVHPNGFLGYVQGVGSNPGSSQPVTYNTTTDFGVGAFLLAGSEVFKLAGGEVPIPGPEPEPEPENLALNNLNDFSEEQAEPPNPASNAVDGKEATRWSAEIFPQWIEIDLGEVKDINTTVVLPYKLRAYQFIIETKVDLNDAYTKIVDRQDNITGGYEIIDTFASTSARYVKLNVTGCHDYTGSWVSILELKIFGEYYTTTEVQGNRNRSKQSGLSYVYPNPFTSSTTICFHLQKPTFTTLKIYNSSGQKVATLIDGIIISGRHEIKWHPNSQPPGGIYFYRLHSEEFTQTKKIILQK